LAAASDTTGAGQGDGAPIRAAVVLPHERHGPRGDGGANRAAEARLGEAVGLTASIGVAIVHTAIHPLRTARPPRCSARARWRW
jgi:GTP-binding protein HflX